MRPAILLLAIGAAWGQDTGAIEGTVTSAATHSPLPNATIRIGSQEPGKFQERSAIADREGAYRVESLPPGDYRVSFAAEGYVGNGSPPVRVAASAVKVNAELWPVSTISGRVLDDGGRPAAGIAVELYRLRIGQPVTTKSDSDGRFSFASVRPGIYGVLARPDTGSKDGSALAPTWFPAFTERAETQPITLRAGSEISGIDIRLKRVAVWSIEGTVADEAGRPLAGARVKLRPADEWQPDEASTVSSAEGKFRFTARPGQWRISAATADGGREGFAPLVVDKHDLEGVPLRLNPPFSLEGFVERDEPRDADGKRKVSGVALMPQGRMGKQVLVFHEQDGMIRFPKVQPGRYTIFPVGYIPGYYLESVKLGDREVMSQAVDLNDGAVSFRVVYRPNAGRVRGTVEKGAGSTVALLPQDETLLDGQFIRTAKCDASGRFEVGSLRPGGYYAFAFDRVDPDAFTDVTFVRNLIPQAVRLQVEPGKVIDSEIKMTLWPE